jgi:hypothetical protein
VEKPQRRRQIAALSGSHPLERAAHDWRQPRRPARHFAGADRIGSRPRPVRRAIVAGRRRVAAFPPQLFQARPDCREIIGGAGSSHLLSQKAFRFFVAQQIG